MKTLKSREKYNENIWLTMKPDAKIEFPNKYKEPELILLETSTVISTCN